MRMGFIMLAAILLLVISGNYLVQAITANIMNALSVEQERVMVQEPVIEPADESELVSEPEFEFESETETETETEPVVEPESLPETVSLPDTEPVVTPIPEKTTVSEKTPKTEAKPVVEPMAEPVAEPVAEPEPEPEPAPVPEPKTEPATENRGYYTVAEVDLSQITKLSNGITIKTDGGHPAYTIKVDRALLPSGIRDFKYISVFSVAGDITNRRIQEMIFTGEEFGYGLQYYSDDRGFLSVFSGDGYLVILYDADYYCVGYQYFESSKFVVNQ